MFTTLPELLQSQYATTRSVHFHQGDGSVESLTYQALLSEACQLNAHLHNAGAQPNDFMLMFLTDNRAFLRGFWGAVVGGVIPVPLAVGIADEHRFKLLRIAKKLANPWLYTDRRSFDRLGDFAARVGETETFDKLRQRVLIAETLELNDTKAPIELNSNQTAFIQFSSGSTSEPKGIVLTHANILANMRSASERSGFCDQDVSFSWMPLTHDMGLIGKHFYMIANGMENHILPTDAFIRRPLLWLEIASRVKATILSSPNFGYRHLLKVLGERQVPNLDLSSVRLIFNGAEPISPALVDEFMRRMEPYALKRSAMYPVYGLAEATLAVAFPQVGSTYHAKVFDRLTLNQGQQAQTTSADSPNALELMCEGTVLPGIELKLVDAQGSEVAAGVVGECWVRGANVTAGYYQMPEATANALTSDHWLKSGDLGLIHEGQLYITGRAKEIIFINGQNYYPHDVEHLVEQLPGLELGKVVAVGARPNHAESDELTIFILHRGSLEDFAPFVLKTQQWVNEKLALEVRHVVPVKRIPKTTSGKIQRLALEKAFVSGEFAAELSQLHALLAAHAPHSPAPPEMPSQPEGVQSGNDTSLEAKLLAICHDMMPGKTLSADDNLFEIGASSLTLIQIHERIDSEFPGLVDLTEMFDYPTIHELAQHLQTKVS